MIYFTPFSERILSEDQSKCIKTYLLIDLLFTVSTHFPDIFFKRQENTYSNHRKGANTMKKILALIILVFCISTSQAYAHTALQSSVPQDGEIIKEPLQEMVLKYATKIEKGSTFELKNSNNETIPVNVTVENDRLKGTTDQPLPNDQYTLDWSIIGADGHPIKGSLAFRVDVPVQASQEPAEEKAEEKAEKQAPETKNEEVVEEKAEETSSSFPVVLVVILGAIAVGSLFFLRKRRG
jgi:copper resistance protein C